MTGCPTIAEALAGFWTDLSPLDLPSAVRSKVGDVLLDTFSVAIPGSGTREARSALAASDLAGSASEASAVWGSARRLDAARAALVNGVASHALELDDFGGCGHSGAVVVPAAVALAEAANADGPTLLKAVACGYDVAARVLAGAGGYRPHNERGWHSTSTCGVFGAAAASAVVLGLTRRQFVSALGIAGSSAGGSWAFLSEGSDTKRLHTGKAAEAGVMAALLARSGLSGPSAIFEDGYGGFFATFCAGDATPSAATDGLGTRFHILETGQKIFPFCRGMHSAIEAAMRLRAEHGLDNASIRGMTVHGARRHVRQFDRRAIGTELDRQFSMPYAMSLVALKGSAEQRYAAADAEEEERIRAGMGRMSLRLDPELGPFDEPTVEILLQDGRSVSGTVPIAVGDFRNPPTAGQVYDKCRSLTRDRVDAASFDELRRRLGELMDAETIGTIVSLISSDLKTSPTAVGVG